MNEVVLWMQFGTKLIQIGIGAYAQIRALVKAAGITDDQMAAADAEYGRRIAQAKAEQKD
jgi:hypothetical protein